MAAFENSLADEEQHHKAAMEKTKVEMEMQGKYFTPNILKQMMLDTSKTACDYGPSKITVQQVGSNVENQQDISGQIINQVFNSFNNLEEVLNDKSKAQAQIVAKK